MKTISYKSKNINNALFHEGKGDILIVWFDGALGQQPELYSLGKLIESGKLNPKYPILMPKAGYGKNGKNITNQELEELINLTGYKKVSIVGWSNGSDATALQVAVAPTRFYRICLISNYTNQWKNCAEYITAPVQILLGAKEKSAAKNRSWPIVDQLKDCKLYRVEPYDHMIGEKIWIDDNYYVLDWLAGVTDDVMKAPRELIRSSKKNQYNENIESKRSI